MSADRVTIDHTPDDHSWEGDTDDCYKRVWGRAFRDAGLGMVPFVVGYILHTYALPDGTCIHPGQYRLYADLQRQGVSKLRASRALALLKEKGWIAVTQEATATEPTVYHLTIP